MGHDFAKSSPGKGYSSVGYMGNHVYIHLDQGPRVASFLLPKWHLLEGAVINIYTYRYCTEYIYIYGCFQKILGKPPKWMVKIMENPMNKWMIWVVLPPYFWFKHPYIYI